MGSSISDERLDANTLQPTQHESNTRQAQQLDVTQLDTIVAAYKTADSVCGRKPGPQPIQPERLLTPDERYAFFYAIAPEMHAAAYDSARQTLLSITADNVQALSPTSPMFEMLTHSNLTLCALLGVPQADLQEHIDSYRRYVSANKDDSHFSHNVHTNGDEAPQIDQWRRYTTHDILMLFCGEDPARQGKIQFSLDGKANVIRFTRPMGRYLDPSLPPLANAVCTRYHRWTIEPAGAPTPVNELQWLSYMAAVSIGSTLCPTLDMDLAHYLVDESDFMRHASGRCFARNFKIDDEKMERRAQQ